MKQTVLGSSGYIGSALKDYLILNGHDVLTPSIEEILEPNRDWGTIYYCIGLTSDFRERPFATIESHVTLVSNVLENVNFESLLYLSSTRVYHGSSDSTEGNRLYVNSMNPSDLYNLSKLTGEAICLNSGHPNVKVARISNVVGKNLNRETFVGELLLQAFAGKIDLISNIDSSKDYISIYDVVEILSRIANDGELSLYNVASGVTLSTRVIIDLIRNYFEIELIQDLSSKPEIYSGINVDLISREFGYKPRSGLAEIGNLLQIIKEGGVQINEQ